jgi:hypothetical protein
MTATRMTTRSKNASSWKLLAWFVNTWQRQGVHDKELGVVHPGCVYRGPTTTCQLKSPALSQRTREGWGTCFCGW